MTSEQPGMESFSFDSADVGEIEAFLSRVYAMMRIEATGPVTRARITRRVLAPGIAFDDLDYVSDIGYHSADPQESLIICDVEANTINRVGEGSDETFGSGDQFLISRPGLPLRGRGHDARLRFTIVDPALLSQVASTRAGTRSSGVAPVRVLDHRPVSREAVTHLRRATAYLRGALHPVVEGGLAAPLVISTAGQLLAASVLHAFPNTAVLDPTGEDRHDAHTTALHRAVVFIDDHADAELSVADIAAAASISPRALQYAFRRHLGTTPLAYLRRVRLDAAHQDLRNADHTNGDTVTAIAARWGFLHPGRFAGAYRNAYGVPPSHTLRR